MPNIKSQKDRVVQAKKENLRNKAVKSNLKTVIKKADSAVAAGSADADKAVVTAVSTIDKACAKGVLHKNNASRKIGRLTSAYTQAVANAQVEAPAKKVVEKAEVKEDLSKLTVAELKKLAKEKNIENYTTMKKAELLDALK